MTDKSRKTAKSNTAIWALLGSCILFFIIAMINGYSVFGNFIAALFYICFIISILLLIKIKRQKKNTEIPKPLEPELVRPKQEQPPENYYDVSKSKFVSSGQDIKPAGIIPDEIPSLKKSNNIPQPIPQKLPVVDIPKRTPLTIPNLLNGRYEIKVKTYRKGGMAYIDLAYDHQTKRDCIIKTPRDDTAHSTTINIEKLEIESRFLRDADHPNIVKFIDTFSVPANTFHLVVDYIEGKDLFHSFGKTPALEDRVLKWARQILDALQYIHKSGHIHRDLNPGNIMLTGNDEVILIDFGTIKDTQDTQGTTVYTKPGFAAPESVYGYADEKTDIYYIGGTLYYLLTSQPPGSIGKRNVADVLLKQNVSQRTAKCIDQALQPEPAFRFGTAIAMRTALLGGSNGSRL